MKPIRVLLVDDHALVRNGIAGLLRQSGSIDVAGETGDGEEVFALLKNLRPDVVLMDIVLPGDNGLQITERLIKEYPDVRVVILSAHSNEVYVSNALRLGAVGYLLKDADISELTFALQAVMRGEVYLTPSVSRQVVSDYVRRLENGAESEILLTERQLEILQLMAQGCTTKEVAQKLFISEKTVHAHRSQMMRRAGVRDMAGLIRYAIRKGIIIA